MSDLIRAHGGIMRSRDIREHASARELHRATVSREVVNNGSGNYSVPGTDRALVAAHRLRGVLSHRSAAAHWGFALPPGDDLDHVIVASNARRKRIPSVVLYYRDVHVADCTSGVTSPVPTVIDCLRDLSIREALAVGDSALRSGLVAYEELVQRSTLLRGPGSRRVRERLGWLDAGAENAFESTCRAILLEDGITGFSTQVSIRSDGRWLGRVDLCHQALRIVIECESFTWHGQLPALNRDCRRYTELEAAGWRVLRVTWRQVMFEPEWVLARVRDAITIARSDSRRTKPKEKRP